MSLHELPGYNGTKGHLETVVPPEVYDRVVQQAVTSSNKRSCVLADEIYEPSNISPIDIPPRDWVYGKMLLCGYITALVAPGGVGKSVLALTFAISIALRRSLLSAINIPKARNVLVLNNEDDRDELNRRIAGVCARFDISLDELADKVFVRSGYQRPVVIASEDKRGRVHESGEVSELIAFMNENKIGLLVVDPFVSFHRVPENDNSRQNAVLAIFRRICAETGAAILMVAHTRKMGRGEQYAGNAEAMRGATAIKDGARIVVTLSRMETNKERRKYRGIDSEVANCLVCLNDAKKNLSAMEKDPSWYLFSSQELPNGDTVGVAEFFDMSSYVKFEGELDSMTAARWAMCIEEVVDGYPEQNRFQYSKFKFALQKSVQCSRTTVENHLLLLSRSSDRPTQIEVAGRLIGYWIEKERRCKTAPWFVNRVELNVSPLPK